MPWEACWILDAPLVIIPGKEMVILSRWVTSLLYKDKWILDLKKKKSHFLIRKPDRGIKPKSAKNKPGAHSEVKWLLTCKGTTLLYNILETPHLLWLGKIL